jgi:hypothetical protein
MTDASSTLWAAAIGVLGVIVGVMVEKYIERRVNHAKDEHFKKEQIRHIDRMSYDRLMDSWHKLLEFQLQHPSLKLEAGDKDVLLDPDSPDFFRRKTLYEFLFAIFEHYVSIRPALLDPDRLGPQTDSAQSWDDWVRNYFRKQSVRQHYVDWRKIYFQAEAVRWLDAVYDEALAERVGASGALSPIQQVSSA